MALRRAEAVGKPFGDGVTLDLTEAMLARSFRRQGRNSTAKNISVLGHRNSAVRPSCLNL